MQQVLTEPRMRCSMSLLCGKFLGSRDEIAIAGNGPNATIQTVKVENDEETGISEFNICHQADLPGKCTDMELCYGSTTSTPFLAVSTANKKKTSVGRIHLLKMDGDLKLESTWDFDHSSNVGPIVYSSLSYSEDRLPMLACGIENGDVSLINCSNGEELDRFTADRCGLNKVIFSNGQLITLGNSKQDQLKIWDRRFNRSSISIPTLSMDHRHSLSHPFGKDGSIENYTSISIDCELQHKLICGTNNGSIAIWDLRYANKPTEITPVPTIYNSHHSKVNSILSYPDKENYIISCDNDGNVTVSDVNKNKHYDIIKDVGTISNLDKITDYVCGDIILATSLLGGLYRVFLNEY
jgi:WD40 repeat protein